MILKFLLETQLLQWMMKQLALLWMLQQSNSILSTVPLGSTMIFLSLSWNMLSTWHGIQTSSPSVYPLKIQPMPAHQPQCQAGVQWLLVEMLTPIFMRLLSMFMVTVTVRLCTIWPKTCCVLVSERVGRMLVKETVVDLSSLQILPTMGHKLSLE